MNKDIVGLLLHHLDPRTALELRRCNHQLNRWVSHHELYWYYQTLGHEGRKYDSLKDAKQGRAAGATRIHVKQWTRSCIDNHGYCRPDYDAAYAWLLETYPDLEVYFREERMRISNQYATKWPNSSEEMRERAGKRHVCISHCMKIDNKFCGREDHFKVAYGEHTIVGGMTEEFLEERRKKEGLYMYRYLFQCYRDTRDKVKSINTQHRADTRAQGIRDKIHLLESELVSLRAELALAEDFARLKEDVKTSIFFRRSEKNYHEREEVKGTF